MKLRLRYSPDATRTDNTNMKLNLSARLRQWVEEATNPAHPNYSHANLDSPIESYEKILVLVRKLHNETDNFDQDDIVALFGLLNSGQRTKKRLADSNPLPELRSALLTLLDSADEPATRIANAAEEIQYAGPAMLGELVGWVHAEKMPLFNHCAVDALSHLGYNVDFADYQGFVVAHEQFKEIYRQEVGRLRDSIPLNLEIDKFYNVIDKVDLALSGTPHRRPQQRYWRITLPDQWKRTKSNGETQLLNVWQICMEHSIAAIDFDGDKENFQVRKFMDLEVGDRVVAFLQHKTIGGIGTVTRTYDERLFEEKPASQDYWDGLLWFRIGVEWQQINLSVDTIPQSVANKFYGQTIIELTSEDFRTVVNAAGLALTENSALPDSPPFVSIHNKVEPLEAISDETGFDLDLLQRWIRAIDDKRQAVLYGPPGTGKTFIAKALARHLIGGGDGFSDLVQFHPAYTYEDFIQGIRPTIFDKQLSYQMVPGRFLDFCRKAEARAGTCVLIVDEINRANLARVFGELMYLLEYRDQEIPLAGGGTLRIPQNVRILGTMNTADRSIALVDHALRRRFAFLALQPDYEILHRYHEGQVTDLTLEKLIAVIQEINVTIRDPHYAVGITFFLRENLAAKLSDIWQMEIEPYLEEYFFDRPDTAARYRWDQVQTRVR